MQSYRQGALWALLALLLIVTSAQATKGRPLTSEEGAQFAAAALRLAEFEWMHQGEVQRGVLYQWGGRTPLAAFAAALASPTGPEGLGLDASGVVIVSAQEVFPTLRFRVPRGEDFAAVTNVNSAQLFAWNVLPVSVDELRPGDLIFFADANGRISGVGIFQMRIERQVRFVVASAQSERVVHTSVNLDGAYWRDRYAGAGRLLHHGTP